MIYLLTCGRTKSSQRPRWGPLVAYPIRRDEQPGDQRQTTIDHFERYLPKMLLVFN
jgi:hypothetical protein